MQFKITVTREHQFAQHSESEPVDVLFRRADCPEAHAKQYFYSTLLPGLNNRHNSGWQFKPIKDDDGQMIGSTTLLLDVEPVYGHFPALFKES